MRIGGSYLNERSFDSGVSNASDSQLIIDLSDLRFIEPYGLVSIATAIHGAVSKNLPIVLSVPRDSNSANYVSRMQLGRVLDSFGITHDLPAVGNSPLEDTLLELQTFECFSAVDRLAALVCHRLSASYDTIGVTDCLYETVVELCNNAVEHAGAAYSYVAAQVYEANTPRQRVIVGIGDAGQGFAGSLSNGGIEVNDDDHAMRLALTEEVTASGQPGRGRGLPDACNLVTQLSGSVMIRSNASRMVRQAGLHNMPSSTPCIPGTVVGVTIPCGVPPNRSRGGISW